MPLLSIEALEIGIAGTRRVHPLNLSLAPGRTLALVGESGSGKSLTALAILGLLPPAAMSRGRVLFRGEDLLAKSEQELDAIRGRDIAMVFQDPQGALNPMQGIGEQVAETIRLHRGLAKEAARIEARELLVRVGLPNEAGLLERRPHTLSGGQRQRVAIAIAIANQPALLIADEPTTALDASTQAKILALLRRLCEQQGCALLLVSHDLALVAGHADEVAVMKEGRIVEQGPAERLFAAPVHRYTRDLIADSRLAPRPARAWIQTGEALLEAKDLVSERTHPSARLFARARTQRVLDHVALSIHPGEAVGLVGESGCGKSTLLRTLLGLEQAGKGQIRLGGQPFTGGGRARALRRRIQLVFQDSGASFDPRWTVGRIVAEPFHLLDPVPGPDEQRRRVDEVLAEVALSPADADRYPHEFSGGQRQRIAIARALVTRPELIVLDEAVSALDVTIRAQILALLDTLAERHGIAWLFASHDLAVVRAITDRVYVMSKGRIVETGPTARVFSHPRHPSTAALLAASPRPLDGRDGAQAWAA